MRMKKKWTGVKKNWVIESGSIDICRCIGIGSSWASTKCMHIMRCIFFCVSRVKYLSLSRLNNMRNAVLFGWGSKAMIVANGVGECAREHVLRVPAVDVSCAEKQKTYYRYIHGQRMLRTGWLAGWLALFDIHHRWEWWNNCNCIRDLYGLGHR